MGRLGGFRIDSASVSGNLPSSRDGFWSVPRAESMALWRLTELLSVWYDTGSDAEIGRSMEPDGDFLKWGRLMGVPPKWMVYNGKSY